MRRPISTASTSVPFRQHWEFLVCDEGLKGPSAALTDFLGAMNLIASIRGDHYPLFMWQWTTTKGHAAKGYKGQGVRVSKPDVVVVSGWHARNGPHLNQLVERDGTICGRLRTVHAHGGHVIGIFNGVALLAEAGLLARTQAVVPWPFVTSVLRHEPTIELVKEKALTEHNRIWSVVSPVLATEVALELFGREPRLELTNLAQVARTVWLHAPERQLLTQTVARDSRSRAGPGPLERARRWLEEHLQDAYSLSAMAEAAGMSKRSLLRHFRGRFGTTPLGMLHNLRVMHARMLLESSYLSIEAVAEKCGWRDVSTFRSVFSRITGVTPAAYRARLSLRTPRRAWGQDLPRK